MNLLTVNYLLLLLLLLDSALARLGAHDAVDRTTAVDDHNDNVEDDMQERQVHHSPRYLKAPDATRIHHEYIVRLVTPESKAVFKTLMEQHPNAEIIREYRHIFSAIAVTGIPQDDMRRFVRDHPDAVLSVEESQTMQTSASATVAKTTDKDPPVWGLDRIDQRRKRLNQKYHTPGHLNGAGIDIYIIDTGVQITHQEFGGRAVVGYDATGGGQAGQDAHGHGTHVASTAAGTVYGVAKGARIVPVRVLGANGMGSLANVLAGMEWVLEQHLKGRTGALSVANLSLGGGFSQYQNDAIQAMVNVGIVVVVAAGNENTDACTKSPGSAPAAITVGSIELMDKRSSFSNTGPCVDIFAPGSGIKGAGINSDTATAIFSGTSMASPHVAGAAALLLQADPTMKGEKAAQALTSMATTGKIKGRGVGTPNSLLYIGGIVSTTRPAEPEPDPEHNEPQPERPTTPGPGQISIYVKYDDYSEETSFVLMKRRNARKWKHIKHVQNPGKKVKDLTVPLTLPDGEYKFVIHDAYNDGMCCQFGQGSYTLTDVGNDNQVFATGGNFLSSESKTFTISGGYVVGGPDGPSSSAATLTMTINYDFYYHETAFSLSKRKKRNKFSTVYFEDAPLTLPSGGKVVPLTLSDGTYKFQVTDLWGDGGGEYSLEANGQKLTSGSIVGSGETVLFQVSGGSVSLL